MFPKKGKLELGGDKLQASLIFGSSEVRGFEGLCRVACNLTPIILLCHVGGMYYWGYFRRVLLPVGHPVVPRVCPWCGQSCSKSLLHDQYKSGQLLRLCAIKIQNVGCWVSSGASWYLQRTKKMARTMNIFLKHA